MAYGTLAGVDLTRPDAFAGGMETFERTLAEVEAFLGEAPPKGR